MKNVDDLIEGAAELAARGLSNGEISDELNVSRETASWLVERGGGTSAGRAGTAERTGPDDIHVDWSAIGRDGNRLSHVGASLADLLESVDDGVDLTVGIEKAGVPLATAVARVLDTDLATYAPRKHQWEEGNMSDLEGSFSRNFASVEGRHCFVVDDTITSGTTMTETVEAIADRGGTPVAGGVLVDKQGVEAVEGVPVHSLVQVIRVGSDGEGDGPEGRR